MRDSNGGNDDGRFGEVRAAGGMATMAALRALLEPPAEALGYELLHLEYAAERGRNVLRVYIDAPGGIRVDDCEAVSRQLSELLDVEEPLRCAYELEVSSPGLDRPLVKPEHFRRHAGRRARIVMRAPGAGRECGDAGRRRYTGELLEADEQRVVLRIDGRRHELAYDEIRTARLEPAFDALLARR